MSLLSRPSSFAVIPYFLDCKLDLKNKSAIHSIFLNLLFVSSGVLLLALMTRVIFPLPWTPVPITGQTFAVTLLSLTYGRRLGFLTVSSYVLLGGLGLPIFANGISGITFGPTFGYLIGMMIASFVVGSLADRGWTKKLWTSYLAGLIGSVFVFGFGLLILSRFVPGDKLLLAGLYPFLLGDLLKTISAAGIARALSSRNH